MGAQLGTVVILENEDDFASARSKMVGAGSRIGLVIPRDCRSFYRSLAFRLLRRWCEDCNVNLTIITRDPPLKRLASEYGFPTCPSVRKIESYWRQEEAIKQASPLKAWLLRNQGRFVSAALAIVVAGLVVGAFAFFVLPQATVRLEPVSRTVSERMIITADPLLSANDSAGMRIPARVIEATVERSDRVPATGKKEGYAKGYVTFANMSEAEVVLPEGTIVTTANNKKFKTLTEVVVPAPRWSSVRAEVVAVEPGSGGEAARLAIIKVEGPEGASVAVLNEQPIAIDSALQRTTVTAEDRDNLRASLLDRLSKQVMADLQSQLMHYETLVAPSANIEILYEEFDHEVGDEATIVELRMGVKGTAMVFDQHHVTELVEQVWERKLGDDEKLAPDSLHIGEVEVVEASADAIKLATQTEGVALRGFDAERIHSVVFGKTPAEAAAILQQEFRLNRTPEVVISPDWAPRAYRVEVIIESQN